MSLWTLGCGPATVKLACEIHSPILTVVFEEDAENRVEFTEWLSAQVISPLTFQVCGGGGFFFDARFALFPLPLLTTTCFLLSRHWGTRACVCVCACVRM